MRLLLQLCLTLLLLSGTSARIEQAHGEPDRLIEAAPAQPVAASLKTLEPHTPHKVTAKPKQSFGGVWHALSAARSRVLGRTCPCRALRTPARRTPRAQLRVARLRLPRLRDDKAEPG